MYVNVLRVINFTDRRKKHCQTIIAKRRIKRSGMDVVLCSSVVIVGFLCIKSCEIQAPSHRIVLALSIVSVFIYLFLILPIFSFAYFQTHGVFYVFITFNLINYTL